jgi:hypothetical protein
MMSAKDSAAPLLADIKGLADINGLPVYEP